MSTPCLECSHLGPIKRIPAGDPREIQVGQQGMLARGLAYCALKLPDQSYQRYRSLTDRDRCPYFERIKDDERIASRRALAERLQREYAVWIKERRARKKQ
jgi:hypothetical protein